MLTGKAGQADHPYLYWEFYEQGGKQAVRWGKWKGVRLDVKADRNGPLELYDLDEDIGETRNVATEHPEIVHKIEDIMDEAHTPSPFFKFE